MQRNRDGRTFGSEGNKNRTGTQPRDGCIPKGQFIDTDASIESIDTQIKNIDIDTKACFIYQ